MFNLYLCEVAIVSQLFIPFLFSTWDVQRLPLLRHAYYAVMPLSRAPTRGRYSRIVGVTRCDSGTAAAPAGILPPVV